MSKATKTQIANTVAAVAAKLKLPTVVEDEAAALDYAYDTAVGRSRPVVAINEEGELVVCCKSTAKKHGWELQGKLYARVRTSKAKASAPAAAPAPVAPAAPKASKGKLEKAVDAEMARLLGM